MTSCGWNLASLVKRHSLEMRLWTTTLSTVVALIAGACSSSADGDSDPSRAVGVHSAVVEFLLEEDAPTDEEGVGLGDRAVVYVLDRTDLQVGSFFCDPVDEFGENPDMCAGMLVVSEVTLLPASVREAIEVAFPVTTRVVFVDDIDQVTKPAQSIVLKQVIDDGGLVQFGPVIGQGPLVHVTVRCFGCDGGDIWLLRLEQAGETWIVEPETVAIA